MAGLPLAHGGFDLRRSTKWSQCLVEGATRRLASDPRLVWHVRDSYQSTKAPKWTWKLLQGPISHPSWYADRWPWKEKEILKCWTRQWAACDDSNLLDVDPGWVTRKGLGWVESVSNVLLLVACTGWAQTGRSTWKDATWKKIPQQIFWALLFSVTRFLDFFPFHFDFIWRLHDIGTRNLAALKHSSNRATGNSFFGGLSCWKLRYLLVTQGWWTQLFCLMPKAPRVAREASWHQGTRARCRGVDRFLWIFLQILPR